MNYILAKVWFSITTTPCIIRCHSLKEALISILSIKIQVIASLQLSVRTARLGYTYSIWSWQSTQEKKQSSTDTVVSLSHSQFTPGIWTIPMKTTNNMAFNVISTPKLSAGSHHSVCDNNPDVCLYKVDNDNGDGDTDKITQESHTKRQYCIWPQKDLIRRSRVPVVRKTTRGPCNAYSVTVWIIPRWTTILHLDSHESFTHYCMPWQKVWLNAPLNLLFVIITAILQPLQSTWITTNVYSPMHY